MSQYHQLYQTTAINTGGRKGVSYLSDGSYEVKIVQPREMGGEGGGSNPEQLFALGYAACFNSALELVLQSEKIKGQSQVSVTVKILKGEGADFQLAVNIEVAIEDQFAEDAQQLAQKAHAVCPYSKAVHGNIEVNVKGVDYDASKQIDA